MMRKFNAMLAPFLLLIGTVGLLLNEFMFVWGRAATLSFAVFSLSGISLLIFSMWHNRRSHVNNSTDLTNKEGV